MKLVYSNKGEAIPDSLAEHRVKQLSWFSKYFSFVVSTENVIYAALALIAEGKLTDVDIYYEDRKLEVDQYGMIKDNPFDTQANFCERGLRAGLHRRIELRKQKDD